MSATAFPVAWEDHARAELLLECASCGAPPGFYCLTGTGRRSRQPHKARRRGVETLGSAILAVAIIRRMSTPAGAAYFRSELRRVERVLGPTLERLLGAGAGESSTDDPLSHVESEPAGDHAHERPQQRH